MTQSVLYHLWTRKARLQTPIHTLWTLKFIKKCCFSQNVVVGCLGKLFTISGEFKQLCSRFDVGASCFSRISFGAIRCVILMNILFYMSSVNIAPFIFFFA